MAFAIASCSSDDDKNSAVAFTGTWKLVSIPFPSGLDLNNDGKGEKDFLKETHCMDNSTIVFPDDIAQAVIDMQSVDIDQADNGDYSVQCIPAVTQYSNCAISGNNVTFIFQGEQLTATKSGRKLTVTMQVGTSYIFKKL